MTPLNDEKRLKLLEKIRKCMALGNDPGAFQHEAAQALAMAQRIMDEYNLTITDIELEEVIEVNVEVDNRSRPIYWKSRLANIIAKAFDCTMFNRPGYGMKVKGFFKASRMSIVGTKVDAEVAVYVLNYLITVIERMQKEYKRNLIVPDYVKMSRGSSTGWSRNMIKSYCIGVVEGLAEKIREFANRKKEEVVTPTGKTGKDLIVLKKNAVDKYMNKIPLKDGTGPGETSHSAKAHGMRDGAKINIHHGVTGSKGHGPKMIG